MDSTGRAYVTGRTRSPNLVILNAYQGLRRSTLDDAFLTKFNAQGDLVTYSTFIGGTGNEAAHGIAVDDSGLANLVGETDSTDFVTTSGAFKKEHGGNLDGFIVKLRTTSSKSDSLVYSSFFGGSGNDLIRAVAVSASGAVYITGVTNSTDFPIQAAVQDQFGGGSSDAFAAKLNSLGTGLVYSTYLGGTAADSGEAIAVLARALIVLVRPRLKLESPSLRASLSPSNFPTTAPLQPQPAGKKDVFVSRIPGGDGSPAAPTVTAGITFDPSSSPQVAQTLTATFTVTNRGGSSAVLKALTLLESDPRQRGAGLSSGTQSGYRTGRLLSVFPRDCSDSNRDVQLQGGLSDCGERLAGHSSGRGQHQPGGCTVENTNNSVAPVNSIEVTANPCEIPFGKTTCTVDITWVTVNAEAPQLRVQDVGIGGPESLFSPDGSGTATIDWIQGAPHKYKFTLYDFGSGSPRELGFMEMTGQEGNPTRRVEEP